MERRTEKKIAQGWLAKAELTTQRNGYGSKEERGLVCNSWRVPMWHPLRLPRAARPLLRAQSGSSHKRGASYPRALLGLLGRGELTPRSSPKLIPGGNVEKRPLFVLENFISYTFPS